jgi:hypothetical protein
MKVRFIKPHPAYGYFPGQEGEVKDPKELIEGGYAVPVKETAETATLPTAETAKKNPVKKK